MLILLFEKRTKRLILNNHIIIEYFYYKDEINCCNKYYAKLLSDTLLRKQDYLSRMDNKHLLRNLVDKIIKVLKVLKVLKVTNKIINK